MALKPGAVVQIKGRPNHLDTRVIKAQHIVSPCKLFQHLPDYSGGVVSKEDEEVSVSK